MSRSSKLAALLVPVAVLLGSCTGSQSGSIDGVWLLESFSVEAEREPVEVGVNTAEQPWIQIDEFLLGSSGCNSFGTPHANTHTYSNGLLQPSDVVGSIKGCLGTGEGVDLMAAEEAFRGMMWDHPQGIEVEVSGSQMVWSAGGTQLVFEAVDEPPPPTTTAPETAIGLLDCSPGTIVDSKVRSDGKDPAQVLSDFAPSVVRVEAASDVDRAGWWWWGYDSGDRVAAAIALGDSEPPEYQVFNCAE